MPARGRRRGAAALAAALGLGVLAAGAAAAGGATAAEVRPHAALVALSKAERGRTDAAGDARIHARALLRREAAAADDAAHGRRSRAAADPEIHVRPPCDLPGYYMVDENSDEPGCKLCRYGTTARRALTAEERCRPCAPGFHKPVAEADACEPCPGEVRRDAAGHAERCAACPPGHYNSTPGADDGCAPCYGLVVRGPDGFTVRCEECPLGTYKESSSADGCEPCKGLVVRNEVDFSTSCERCDVGTYKYPDDFGKTACDPCPGKVVLDGPDRVDCLPCGEGQYKPNTPQDGCSDIPGLNYTIRAGYPP